MNITAPSPDEIKAARRAAKLTQGEAAELVHLGSLQRWAEYEQSKRNIDIARWELFLIKTGQHTDYQSKEAQRPRERAETRKCEEQNE